MKKNQTKFTLAILPLLLLSNYSSLSFAAGEFVKDTKTGCNVYDLDDAKYSASWSGICVDGKISGKGTLTTTDKKTNLSCENKGEMKAGLRTGHSVSDCAEGFHFEGDYKPVAGVVNGKGTLNFPNGGKYVGEFKGWTLHGQGTYTDASGKAISGTFENNKLVQGDAGAGTASNKALHEMIGLVTKSASLAQQNPAEATALLKQFLSTYTQLPKEVYTSPDFQGLVSTALYSKGVALLVQDKKDEYLALYDEFSAHYEKLPQQIKDSPEAQLRMAGLTYSKGWLLDKHGEIDKGIASWDENNRRFGKSTDPEMKKVVADGLNSKASSNSLKNLNLVAATLKKALALFKQEKYAETIVVLDDFHSQFKQISDEYKNSAKMQEMLSSTYVMKATAYSKLGQFDECLVTHNEFHQQFSDSTDPKIKADVEKMHTIFIDTVYASTMNDPASASEDFGKCNKQDVKTWEGHACYVATENHYSGSKNPEVQAIVRKNHAIAQGYDGKDEATKYKTASGQYTSATQSDAACIDGGMGGIFNTLFEGGGVIWFTSIDGTPMHDKKVCVPPGEHTVCFSSGGSLTGVERSDICTKGNFAAAKKYKVKSSTGARTQNGNSRTNGAYETHDQVTYEKFDYTIEEVK